MNTLVSTPPVSYSIQQQHGRLVSVSQLCPGVSLPQFLAHARGTPRCFWESPNGETAFAGAGAVLEIMAWGKERFKQVQQRAADVFAEAFVLETEEPLAVPRLFGGFAFRDDFLPDLAWSDFTPAHLILPHYQLTQGHTGMWLTLNAQVPFDENPRNLISELRAALNVKIAELQAAPVSSAPRSNAGNLDYPMSLAAWTQTIEQATTRIQAGELQKVVLARIAEVGCADNVDVDGTLARLTHNYPDTYRFVFEPRPRCAFFGATPELLAQVRGDDVLTMALAGSTRRGSTPAEDAALLRQLLASSKDRFEHQIVLDKIRACLEPRTSTLDIGETGVMTLSNIHHVYTAVRGKLQRREGILPIIAALHPTPALGGEPREAAMHCISDLEPFPRGWYAAPVGWIDCHMDGQFGVAIRSAVAQGRRVWLYAGAGIVAASDPQREWEETALKFQPVLNALSCAGL